MYNGRFSGARTINDAAVEILKTLTDKYDVQVIFQTGKKNFERVVEQLLKFILNMNLIKT